MAAGFMTQVTCRLTAKNRDQLRNPTLGNQVLATFTFFTYFLTGVIYSLCFICPLFRFNGAVSTVCHQPCSSNVVYSHKNFKQKPATMALCRFGDFGSVIEICHLSI